MPALTLKQAAEWLQVNDETLRRAAKSGKIGNKQLGVWRFTEKALENFVNGVHSTHEQEPLRLIKGGKQQKCPSINAAKTKRGGLITPTQTANEYANLLGLKTNGRQ